MQQQKKIKPTNKQKENAQTKKAHKRAKKRRKAHKGANKHVIKQICYQAKEDGLEGQMWVWIWCL